MELHTPARKDKHLHTTLLFVAVLVLNHKLGLQLSIGELGLLAAVTGVYMGQSQLGAIAKLRAAFNEEEEVLDGKPAGHPVAKDS